MSSDFSVGLSSSLQGYSESLGHYLELSLYSLFPVAYADELTDSSMAAVQKDTSLGGQLIQQSLFNLIKDIPLVPIYLTPKGIEAASLLSEMLNTLAKSDFKDDSQLYSFLRSAKSSYNIHYTLSNGHLLPHNKYTLPLKYQEVEFGEDSGVYGFFFNGDEKLGLGSAISCRTRLTDHMASFYDNRPQQFMHKYVMRNGGLTHLT